MSCLFAIGILLSIALIGLLTAWAGRLLGDLGPWGNYLVAGVLFIFGLHLWGVLPTPWDAVPVNTQRKGLLAAFFDRSDFRHRPWTLYICLHGPGSQRCLYRGK